MSIRLLSKEDIQAVELSLADVLQLTQEAYVRDARGMVDVPTKIGIHPSSPHSFLDAMPAWVGGGEAALGMKWISYFPANSALGIEDSSGLIILNHPDHGHPVCIMEGMHLTFLRTAACAAIMARQVINAPPSSIGLVGCGNLGRWSLRVMAQAFPSIETVYVASNTAQSRERFCEEMRQEGGWKLVPVDSVRDAVYRSQIVVSSVPPTARPPIEAQWLLPDSVFIPLDLANSWQADVLPQAARVVADNPEFLQKLLNKHRPELADVRPRTVPFQQLALDGIPAGQRKGMTFLAVCGIASTDVMLGWEVYRRACKANRGVMFDMLPGKAHARPSDNNGQLAYQSGT
ncbi:hypothetical protein [Eoetvoesiella caeni]